VKVKPNNQDFEFGYFMFTTLAEAPCGRGNIQKLLREGQFSLFRQADGSGSLITGLTEEGRLATYEDNYSDDFLAEKTIVNGFASQNKLTIKLSGAKILQILFAHQPKYVTFTTQILESKKATGVPVTYTSKFLSAKTASLQDSNIKNRTAICLSPEDAENLINEIVPNDLIRDDISERGNQAYRQLNLVDIKQAFPITYLYYQKGYLKLEYNGYSSFSSITSKGQQLNNEYPDGFPFATKTLVSINKISCVGKKMRVDITYKVSPTETALEVLGRDVYAVKPFSQLWKVGIEFAFENGAWHLLTENFSLSPWIN
jgi:hypothetical protein